MKKHIYKYKDIFKSIPNDPENILLKIPEEVCKLADFVPGDKVKVEIINNSLHIKKIR